MSLDAFEEAVNEVSDKDWTWWPFLWLRPQQHEPLGLARVVAFSFLYGLPCSGLACLALAFVRPETRAMVPFVGLGFPLAFLFLGSVIIAPMWNRRAERLRRRR